MTVPADVISILGPVHPQMTALERPGSRIWGPPRHPLRAECHCLVEAHGQALPGPPGGVPSEVRAGLRRWISLELPRPSVFRGDPGRTSGLTLLIIRNLAQGETTMIGRLPLRPRPRWPGRCRERQALPALSVRVSSSAAMRAVKGRASIPRRPAARCSMTAISAPHEATQRRACRSAKRRNRRRPAGRREAGGLCAGRRVEPDA
jgi:hypothetical protein